MLHTELLQICANFSLTFPKVRLHCPLSAPRQVGAQFAIMPITRHHTVKSLAFTFYQLCAQMCSILYEVFFGKAMFQAPKKDCMQDKDEINYFKERGVYEKVPVSECWEKTERDKMVANCVTVEDTRGPLAASWDGQCGHLRT